MTNATATHPAAERLTAFSWGKLNDGDASEIAAHLDTCADCQRAVETQPDDALVSLVRKVVTQTSQQASTATLVESWIPTELLAHPRYRLVRWLGAGGMGVVYQAEHRLMERQVALKVISKKLTENADSVARFQKEVKAAAKLSHPNIVTAYDAEQAGDLHFLVMEFIEGKHLARLVDDGGTLPFGLACEYVRQAALGLQHAFEQGMVHRDIKPQNLMLTPKGQVKILDFGLAGFFNENGPVGSLTKFGLGLGTPDYVAPEQIRNTHYADIRADIYSLGCTFYYLLTGQPPFPEGSSSQKLVAHLERTPKAISDLRGDLPVELVGIVERMMAKGADQRFQKPVEVADVLALLAHDNRDRQSQNPTKLNRYLIRGGLLGGIIASIFVFDLPGKLMPFFKHQHEDSQYSTDPQNKEKQRQVSTEPEGNGELKPVPSEKISDKTRPVSTKSELERAKAKFADVHIDESFREILLSNPGLMQTPGAKLIKTPEGNYLLLGIASTILKDEGPAERLRAEQVCKIKALREVVATTHGVQIGSIQKLEDRNVVVIDKEGIKSSTISDFLQITTAQVEGIAQNMTVIGWWTSREEMLALPFIGAGLGEIRAEA